MEYLVGTLLALAITALAAGAGFDRDRSFGVVITFVVATYYVLFAVIGGSSQTIAAELAAAAAFALVAMIGLRTNLLLVAAAITAHGVFDLVHHLFIDNPGVPRWWPGFCMSYDVVFGIGLGMLLKRRAATRPA